MGYNKLTLYGQQNCDYLYIQKGQIQDYSFDGVDSEPTEWTTNTLLFAKFDDENLAAGNSELISSIAGYEIRRKKGSHTYTEYVGTVKENDGGASSQPFIIDYMTANNSDYTYYLYPSINGSIANSGNILAPTVTKSVKTKWNYWSLLVVDETEDENVFYLSKIFKFKYNLNQGDMNNNASTTVNKNFTKHPTVQHGMSNYWSGELSSLCGFISCYNYEYIITPSMVDEIKNITSDTRRKFLKDLDGNIWEVDITAPITVSSDNNTSQNAKTMRIQWTEVGDAANISIINNPSQSYQSWILTETGQSVPYVEYMWDEHYVWDNSYRWTSNSNVLDTDISNMGRDLFEKNGGE